MRVEARYSERERRVLRLWLRLARAVRGLETAVNAEMIKTYGHRFVRFDIMSQLYREPDQRLSIGELGARLVAPSGNISRLLDRMEADDMVARVPDESDRRRYLIELTENGRRQFVEMALTNAKFVSAAFSDIDDDMLDRLETELRPISRFRE